MQITASGAQCLLCAKSGLVQQNFRLFDQLVGDRELQKEKRPPVFRSR